MIGDGVRGLSLARGLLSPLFGVRGDMKIGVLLAEFCKETISDSELLRFFLGGPRIAWPSPMVLRGREFSNENAPRIVGRSRETGRFGERPAKFAMSVEFKR